MTLRLAIVATHPVQYLAPWYRHLASVSGMATRVFYLWDFGVEKRFDPGFGHVVQWDIPLLSGYSYAFVPNRSRHPGTHQGVWGIWNPSIVRELREWKPDAVLLFGYNFASLLYLIFSWPIDKTPLLLRGDSHRLVERRGMLETIRRALIGRVFRRFAAFLYVGTANRQYFRHHGVPDSKLFSAPHAVDNERFFTVEAAARREAREWRRNLGIPEDHRVVLFAGKFESKKHPMDLLRAFLRADLPRASLLFVGGGALEESLTTAAGSHSNIHFAPFQNQTAMPRVYAAADVFVLPSYGPHETWGLAVNEAMCMGVAVIASDHVGCARDLIRERENGLVFPAGDVDALSRCLEEALSEDRANQWGARGRQLIEGFSYRQATHGLVQALASVRQT